jgi:hypothetical protein
MLGRIAVGLLLCGLLLSAWLLRGVERSTGLVRAQAPQRPRTELGGSLGDLAEPDAGVSRSTAVVAQASGGPAQAAAAPVRVIVRLESPHVARDWVGSWSFELQTWDEGLDTVELHARTADGEGRAEFELPGPTHVDWVRVVPPEMSGLALAFVEEHEDLEPGAVHEVVLAPGPGGRISGSVTDLDGRPVVGARVHAYAEGVMSLPDWQPGLVAAETDRRGRFRMPRLQPGDWSLCADPYAWLGLSPPTGESIRDANQFRVRADIDVDDALLTVVPSNTFTLRVLDTSGEPVPGASVRMEPLQLLGGRMALERPPDPDPLETFLRPESDVGGRESTPWPYGALHSGTQANGEARVVGVSGVWNLSLWAPASQDDVPALQQRIDLPASDLTWTLPGRFGIHRGRIEDERGSAIEGAWASLRVRGDGEFVAVRRTDAQGHYAFRWLDPGKSYEVVVRRNGFLTSVVDISPTSPEAPPQVAVLRAAETLRVTLVDRAAQPIRGATLILQDVRPADPLTGEPSALELERRSWLRTDAQGTLQLAGVPQGQIDLGLQRDVAVLDGDGRPMIEPWGHVRSTQLLAHRWTLSVPPAEHRLVVDLSAWPEPQAPELATHTGLVVDSATGSAIADALVLVQTQAFCRATRSDDEGRFWVQGLPAPCELLVQADGYTALRIPQRDWEPVEHQHEFALAAGSDACAIVLVDRLGERLPTVKVSVRDAEERPLRVLLRGPDLDFIFLPEVKALDGRLILLAPPPGILDLEVELTGVGSLGRCKVSVGALPATREIVARLDRSLDELRAEVLARRAEDPR